MDTQKLIKKMHPHSCTDTKNEEISKWQFLTTEAPISEINSFTNIQARRTQKTSGRKASIEGLFS